jgi:hypothetical protein
VTHRKRRTHVFLRGIFPDAELTRHGESAKMSVFSEGYSRNDFSSWRLLVSSEALAALCPGDVGPMSGFARFVRDSFPWGVAKW